MASVGLVVGGEWMKGERKRFSIQFERDSQVDVRGVEFLQTRRHLLWEECLVDGGAMYE